MKYYVLIAFMPILISCQKKTDIELLIEYGAHLKDLEAFEYQIDHLTEYTYLDKPTHRKGVAYFEKNLQDTLIGYNFHFYTEMDPGRYITFYGGDKQVGMILHDSVAYIKDVLKYPDYQAFSLPFLHESIVSIGKWLANDSLEYMISNLEMRDTVISSVKCKLFSFNTVGFFYNWWYWESKPTNTHEIEVAFDIRNKTPLFLRSKMHFRDTDYALKTVRFSNLIEKRYPVEKLSIESVPEHYRWGLRQTKLALHTESPNFNLPGINGDSIELASLRNKYVLLQFGWVGCGPCVKSIPLLNQLEQKYASSGLKVVGVNIGSSKKTVTEYVDRYGIDYSFLWSDNDKIIELYKISAAPTLYIIDKEGIIIYAQIGLNEEKLKNELEKLFGT